MTVEVKIEYPPNYDEILKVFPLKHYKPIFAFSPSIYNPHNVHINAALYVHEKVHISRQWLNPKEWWDKYLVEDEFRLAEEILAHVAEYKFLADSCRDRKERRQYFNIVSGRLCEPLYGYNPPLTFERAKKFMKMALKEGRIF